MQDMKGLGKMQLGFGATHSSPFRDTVARGILTGTGMFGKPQS